MVTIPPSPYAPQVLAREEAQAAQVPQSSGAFLLVGGAECLGVIFDDFQTVPGSDGVNFIHVRWLPVQVHGKDGLGARSNGIFDLLCINEVGFGVDIHENWLCTDGHHGTGSGKEGVSWDDDLVPRADADRIRRLISDEIPEKLKTDNAYQNAQANSDKQNARIEHDKALARVITALLQDDTELFKQFFDNESFRSWLADKLFGLTYKPQPGSNMGI